MEKRIKKIEGFRILSKKLFSDQYQLSSILGLENTYSLLSSIQKAAKSRKKGLILEIDHGVGFYEKIYIWKESFKKLEKLIYDMIKEIQKQY